MLRTRLSSRSGLLLPVAAVVLTGLGVAVLVAVGVVIVRQTGDGWADDGRDGPEYAEVGSFTAVPADPRPGPDASTGSWSPHCGRNTEGHSNADNVIVSPGRPGAAEHVHDYVGNDSTDAASTDATLASAGTTCDDDDRSSYFWPVLRLGDNSDISTNDRRGVVLPSDVRIVFSGNATSEVVAMPEFLRMTAAEARAVLTGGLARSSPGTPRARWGCSGTAGRFTTRYPRCPAGEATVRTYDFPSCWDGANTDSQDHRKHVVFPAGNGACPGSTFPVPHLRITVSYDLPDGRPFTIDAIPGQQRSASTDHGHFIDVMSPQLRAHVVDCINRGEHC